MKIIILFFLGTFGTRSVLSRFFRTFKQNSYTSRRGYTNFDKRNVVQGFLKYYNTTDKNNSNLRYQSQNRRSTSSLVFHQIENREYFFDYFSCSLDRKNYNITFFLPFVYKNNQGCPEIEKIAKHKVNYYYYFVDNLIKETFYNKTSGKEDCSIENSIFVKEINDLINEMLTKESQFLKYLDDGKYPLVYFKEYKKSLPFFKNIKDYSDLILSMSNKGDNNITLEISENSILISDILKNRNIFLISIIKDSHIKNQDEVLRSLKEKNISDSFSLSSEYEKLYSICCDLSNIFNFYVNFKYRDERKSNDWILFQIITSI